jgi:hypothetical protein
VVKLGRRTPLLMHSSTRRSDSPDDMAWPTTLLRLFSTSNSSDHWESEAQCGVRAQSSLKIRIMSTQLFTWAALAYIGVNNFVERFVCKLRLIKVLGNKTLIDFIDSVRYKMIFLLSEPGHIFNFHMWYNIFIASLLARCYVRCD